MTDELTPITEPGKYMVTLYDPYFLKLKEKDGIDYRFAVVLPGKTEDGKYIEGRLFFTPQIRQGGVNKGRLEAEISAAKCEELGVEPPFAPNKLIDLDGVTCEFDVQLEEYEGNETLKVKWINAHSIEPMQVADVDVMWAKLTKSEGVAKAEPVEDGKAVTKGKGDEDLPF